MLIIEDSPSFCRILRALCERVPGVEVVGVARTSEKGLELIDARRPDLVTLDVLLPDRGGIESLREIRQRHPGVRVVMVSSRTTRGAVETVECLQLGASDYVPKPSSLDGAGGGLERLGQALRGRIEALLPDSNDALPPPSVGGAGPASDRPGPRPDRVDVIAIAASTGGPAALTAVLPALAKAFPVPIVVVQHILPEFADHLATSLNRRCALPVQLAEDGAALRPGRVYVAPNGVHTLVDERGGQPVLRHSSGRPVQHCRPAADVLLRSLPGAFGPRCLAVVLTGTGADGRDGAGAVRRAGGWVIAQQPAEAVARGMPDAVIAAGYADEVVTLERVAARLEELAGLGREGAR